jgi:hypothetical protein
MRQQPNGGLGNTDEQIDPIKPLSPFVFSRKLNAKKDPEIRKPITQIN